MVRRIASTVVRHVPGALALLFAAGIPQHALAASRIYDILRSIIGIFDSILFILFAIATIAFFWGIIRYIASAGDEKAKTDGRRLMTYGIIGLALMAVAWGIVRALQEFFEIPFSGIRLGY